MNLARSTRSDRGFNLFELLIVLAIIFGLLAFLVPAVMRSRPTSIYCVNHLKQVGLAFVVWAGDHQDKFPMQVSVTNGGTMELNTGPNAFRHLAVMSNELNTPKILFCPDESGSIRQRATTFEVPARGSGETAFTGNTNLSYFVGVDAICRSPQAFLAGDHNITNGLAIVNGMLNVPTNRPTAWTAEIHQNRGNIVLGDASVQTFNPQQLQNALPYTGFATNRLTMP
jgi:prepilin-type N-terminal cleavage/methylation domain-containing protein